MVEELEAQDPGVERRSAGQTDLTLDQKTFLITQKSLKATYKDIVRRWPDRFTREPPTMRTVFRVLKRAREENSIKSRKCNSGRKRTVRTKAMIEEVKRRLDEKSSAKPNESVDRGNNNQWKLKQTSFYNIMKDIGYHPYRVRRHQEITPLNAQKRLEFCRIMKEKPDDFYKYLITTDEKMWVVKGHVYPSKNCTLWSKYGEGCPSNWYSQSKVFPGKVHVWAAACGTGDVFGPYFIEGTLTSASYIELLRDQVFPDMRNRLGEEMFGKMWFQQDGAAPHRTRATIDFLESVFGNRIIALNSRRVGGTEWPPASPDMAPPDFHLWNALEQLVYFGDNPPTDVDSLKSALVAAFANLNREEVRRAVTQGMRSRINQCYEANGGHLEGKKKKTEMDVVPPTSVKLLPCTYAHIREQSGNEKLVLGPISYKLLEGETIQVGPSPFIHIPARHCALVKYEGVVQERTGESFPLFPGETLLSIQKLKEVECEEKSGFFSGFIPPPLLEIPDAVGPGSVSVPPLIKVTVTDAKERILDLADKKNEDLQHDLRILKDISRRAESLKDEEVRKSVCREIEEKISRLEGPQLINRLPITLEESQRSPRKSKFIANDAMFNSPLFARSRSPRQRTPSPRVPRKSMVVQERKERTPVHQPLPMISEEMCTVIDKVMALPSTALVAEYCRIQIRRREIDSLKDYQWVTSDILDYMFCLIAARTEATHSLAFHFIQFLSNGGHKAVEKHTRGIDLFSFKKIIIPIHTPGHWSCVGIDMEKKRIIYFDSKGWKNQACLEMLRNYLAEEHQVRKNCALNLSDWTLTHAEDIPKQINDDCGIFTIKFAQYFARGSQMTFKEENMRYYRKRMVWEIKQKILMWP